MSTSTDQLLGPGSRVNHPEHGVGVIVRLHAAAYDVSFVDLGVKTVGKTYTGWEVIEGVAPDEPVTWTDAERGLLKVLRAYSTTGETVELGGKWDGGTLTLTPGEAGLKSKEIPIEDFFHKIVMVRDRLRVMEQRVNASKLTDAEKVGLQQYITRIYGSLTSFNVLFARKADQFRGASTR